MALISGSSEFLVSSFLTVGSSFVGQGSPLWSVHGSLLQLFRLDVTPLEIGFDGVFVSQLWAALVSLAELKLSTHQASWHPKLLHADYMPHPSKLGLDEHGLDAGGVCTVQDLKICDAVLPFDSKYVTKSSHVERFQLLDVSTIQCPRFTTVKEGGENHSIVDY